LCYNKKMEYKGNDLKLAIQQDMESFSRTGKKLASYFLEHWEQIPLVSIKDISKETGVSTASISRFTHQYGFKGFYGFKEKIKTEVKETINPVERFRLMKADISGKESLSKVAKQDVKNINKLLSEIPDQTFENLVRIIHSSKRIYSYGASISSIFSSFIRYIFNQVQKETYCLDDGNVSVEERILSVAREDLIILLSFFPYSKCTIEYAQLAKELGLKVVAISDNEYSPISSHSSLVVPIPRENILFTTSISAFSVLINSIATEIALKKKDRLSASIDEADKILKKFYYLK